VVERAFELIHRHRLAGHRLDLEVSVSARSLAERRFAELVGERIAASGIDPTSLIFEVSEAVAVESPDEVRLFAEQLKELGCRFALDDFGTKHASLSHLKDLPVDFVKIDGAFIRHLADDEAERRIVRAVIELAHRLGQTVIAASVGDHETMELLRHWGADYVQGFSVGQPRLAAELM
jgi:EAL domain-containing protein (putative c-di-GMP-specific phosphodiesterase class I)